MRCCILGASSELKFVILDFGDRKISVGGELQIGCGVLGFNAKLHWMPTYYMLRHYCIVDPIYGIHGSGNSQYPVHNWWGPICNSIDFWTTGRGKVHMVCGKNNPFLGEDTKFIFGCPSLHASCILSSSMWLMSNLHRSQQLNLFRELPSRHAYDGHATTQSSSCLCKRCVLHGQNYHVNILSYNLRSSHLTTYKFPGASLWSLTYPS
jgi:hypothetical protein